MNRLSFILPAFVATLALTAFTPNALAQAQTQAAAQGGSASLTLNPLVHQVARNLPPMVVEGHRVPLPIALQVIKKGLKLPWTNNLNDYRIRCRVDSSDDSHLPVMYCESNHHHIVRVRRLREGLFNALAGVGGNSIPVEDVNSSFGVVRALPVLSLLHKIPSAHASYTLRVTDHGKPAVDYVIKNGELVKIRHYAYQKAPNAKH
ncbi:MAG: hypothetical protein ACRES9_07385 [Gammaproteobacteria bacterium]